MEKYLKPTQMLDYKNTTIQQLILERNWQDKPDFDKILEVYNFVRDEIDFGYNKNDNLSGLAVLEDGYGQCNTKGTLLMTLLRGVGIPCRIHGFTIDKALQKGAITGIWYKLAPQSVIHSWVEIFYENEWYNLEGFIIDKKYLNQIQVKFADNQGSFLGYGIATTNLAKPKIDWNKNNTYIQKEGINQDFGVFDAPDNFFLTHKQKLSPIKEFIYQHVARKMMNRNVRRIRKGVKK